MARQAKTNSSIKIIRMAEKGPCNHCGVESTPLWRTGPNGEPTLCNACGLRWKTRGDLHNYIPKTSFTKGNGIKVTIVDKAQIQRGSDKSGDTTSGGSTLSFLDKNIELESESVEEYSGLSRPNFLGPHIPRKKRSKLDRYALTPVEVLQRKLLDILHQPEFAYLREEEEELLFTQNKQISSGEIGLGCVLLKSPGSDSKNE